ncbi:hypothetical protein C5167_031929 [Papaver somniferum]|uniref:Uncharacterized protein n=1 Tax=Papaver somniferum TaxID=3469 RepID=A0A4Y7K6Y9_PAPSO|nr:hypothetical protein C5167_031929 [Papaver somniferum]
MHLNTELPWNVVVPAEQLHGEGLLLEEAIILQLLEDFSDHKATSEYGYFVAPTSLERIGDEKVRRRSLPHCFQLYHLQTVQGRDPLRRCNQYHETGGFPKLWSH